VCVSTACRLWIDALGAKGLASRRGGAPLRLQEAVAVDASSCPLCRGDDAKGVLFGGAMLLLLLLLLRRLLVD
jgi:hypothetical protein